MFFLCVVVFLFLGRAGGGRPDDGPDDAIDINDDLAEAGADDVPF